ncbi:MAG: pyridoxal 5'-phosphate synthase glutaminase subunit PdxT [Thermoproteus sp.]
MKIGILALQGDVEEHAQAALKAAEELGVSAQVAEVKAPRDLSALDALILTGGESTTISLLTSRAGLKEAVRDVINSGVPTLATCAGMIYLAKRIRGGTPRQTSLEVLDVEVLRNAFGRQRESFEVKLTVDGFGEVDAIFIRAPAVTSVWGSARSIASLTHKSLGEVSVAVRQNNVLATAFHPELSTTAFHKWLIVEAKR